MFDRATGAAQAQYAYPVDRVQAEPVPAGQFAVSGATEILAITDTRFLVLERSFSVGVVGNQVRLCEIDVRRATDVRDTPSLTGAAYVPVAKRLVLDFESLKASLGGIARMSFVATTARDAPWPWVPSSSPRLIATVDIDHRRHLLVIAATHAGASM